MLFRVVCDPKVIWEKKIQSLQEDLKVTCKFDLNNYRKCKINITYLCHFLDLNPNITMERNGSMPNINMIGNRTPLDKTKQLRFEYDKYLSSLEAKYALQAIQKKITSNIIEQKKVFLEEFETLKHQLVSLSEELKSINELTIDKNHIDKKIEVLENISK